jgi:hypothetical protein
LDVKWHPVWPVVYLPEWPRQSDEGERYTTITQWWNGNNGYDLIDGELYEHNKRTAFLEFVELPRLTGMELELAANVTPGEVEDRALLAENGWRLLQPHDVAGTPWNYRRYVQHSRGEFSCAKPSVVKTTPGWISDRSRAYLASGRPCVVQAAGAERHLPRSLGIQSSARSSRRSRRCVLWNAITRGRAARRVFSRKNFSRLRRCCRACCNSSVRIGNGPAMLGGAAQPIKSDAELVHIPSDELRSVCGTTLHSREPPLVIMPR